MLDEGNKIKPKFQVNNLVRTADLRRNFSKGDTTNWSCIKSQKLFMIQNRVIALTIYQSVITKPY